MDNMKFRDAHAHMADSNGPPTTSASRVPFGGPRRRRPMGPRHPDRRSARRRPRRPIAGSPAPTTSPRRDRPRRARLIEADLRPGRQRATDVVAAIRAQADEGIEHVIVNLPDAHVLERLDTFGREVIPAVA